MDAATAPRRWLTRRRVRRWAMAFGIGLVSWLVVSVVVTYRLTRRPHPPFAEPAPAVAWGVLEPLRLTTDDGHDLGAWFADGRGEAPSVVVLHGNAGSRRNSLGRAEVLARGGCAVLLVSLRAHGDSSGDSNDFGYAARRDVVAAVDYLERRRPGRPIVVHGTSMGAAAAVFAAGNLGHRVGGYILESPYRDLRTAVRNRTAEALPPVLDTVAYAGLALSATLVLPHLDQIAPVEAIGAIPRDIPVLILAGGADRKARPDEALALHRRVAGHGRLVLFDRAGHHALPESDPARYEELLRGFLAALGR